MDVFRYCQLTANELVSGVSEQFEQHRGRFTLLPGTMPRKPSEQMPEIARRAAAPPGVFSQLAGVLDLSVNQRVLGWAYLLEEIDSVIALEMTELQRPWTNGHAVECIRYLDGAWQLGSIVGSKLDGTRQCRRHPGQGQCDLGTRPLARTRGLGAHSQARNKRGSRDDHL